MNFHFEDDPFTNFDRQLAEATSKGVAEPTAMILATADKNGLPSARAVLFKGFIEEGFSFYTNYLSPKGSDLDNNPHATLLFYWGPLFRQIRIQGAVKKVSDSQSEKYFLSRPRLSQIGAWASQQSEEIPSYDFLSKKVEELEEKYKGKSVPRPEHWGGFVVIPTTIEFWFGKEGRLHERYIYERKNIKDKIWRRYLKSP